MVFFGSHSQLEKMAEARVKTRSGTERGLTCGRHLTRGLTSVSVCGIGSAPVVVFVLRTKTSLVLALDLMCIVLSFRVKHYTVIVKHNLL